jgi:nicotinamidase/pyrazinamidase
VKRILVDVDTQHDFVRPGGALYVEAPPTVPEGVRTLLQRAAKDGTPVVGSVDSHAHDAWEFEANGGPFPAHCVKGQPGWLRVVPELPARTRFLPMQAVEGELGVLVGESRQGQGNRALDARTLVGEALEGVGLYFEKEVYSLFSNPLAEPILAALVDACGGPDAVVFDVLGYCTGGYCVDAAALGLRQRDYRVRVLGWATAAIGGSEGERRSRDELTAAGIEWVEAP